MKPNKTATSLVNTVYIGDSRRFMVKSVAMHWSSPRPIWASRNLWLKSMYFDTFWQTEDTFLRLSGVGCNIIPADFLVEIVKISQVTLKIRSYSNPQAPHSLCFYSLTVYVPI